MSKAFLCLALLCLGTIIIASEVHEQYVIRPSVSSQSPSCGDRSYCNEEYDNHHLTLSQFVSNLSDYLTNDTRLIFSPGNYSLESDLIVENVHSFSVFAWLWYSSKAVIVCDHNARFEFKNVSIVTVSGLEFIGCFENYVVSVSQFHLENSSFFGHGLAIDNGTALTIDESTANLDRVAFISVTVVKLPEINCTVHATNFPMDRVIGISLKTSTIRITNSLFKGNSGGVIYDGFGSDITIVNTTFVNNSASNLFLNHHYFDCNISRDIAIRTFGGIVYSNSHGSAVKIYDSKFVKNVGVIIFGDNNCNILITHTKFINNKYDGFIVGTIYANNTNLVISHSTFINNNGYVLYARYTNVSINHSEFVSNNREFVDTVIGLLIYLDGEMIASIDHCRFINNTGSLYA